MLPIAHDHAIDIVILNTNNIADYQQPLVAPLLDRLSQEYAGDYNNLVTDNRSWLLALHPLHGIVGGLCLSPPQAPPAVASYNKPVFEFYQVAQQSWLASHLFFLDEELEAKLVDADLIAWHSRVFQEFYHVLVKLSAVGKLPTVAVLIDQDLYTNLNHVQLPYLHEQHVNLGNQPVVFSQLSLPPAAKKPAAHFKHTNEGNQHVKVIH